jgi:hypothetical protein
MLDLGLVGWELERELGRRVIFISHRIFLSYTPRDASF